MQDNAGIRLFALNSNPELAQKISAGLNVELSDVSVKHFSDGEIQININDSVRGQDVFVIQSTSYPIHENFMELMIMVDALRRASAGTINCVIPYYGYADVDHETRPRQAITAKLLADFLTIAGVDRVITMDLHAGQLQGFFNIPVDHLVAIYRQVKYLKKIGLDKGTVIVAPDNDGVKKGRNLAELLKTPLAIVDDGIDPNEIDVIGDVKGKRCIIFDDMINTGAKIATAATVLKDAGATKVYACATHPILAGNAPQILANSSLEKVIVTDTINIPPKKQFAKLHVLSVAPIFVEAISLIYHNQSVSSLFNKDDDI